MSLSTFLYLGRCKSGLIESIPLICTLPTQGQYSVLSQSDTTQGVPLGMTEVSEGLAVGNMFLFLMSSLRVHFKAHSSGLVAVTSFVCWHGRQHFSFTPYWWENFPQSFFGKYWKLLCFVSTYVNLSSTNLNRVKKYLSVCLYVGLFICAC